MMTDFRYYAINIIKPQFIILIKYVNFSES